MIVNTNKDSYDELHILAADARATRRRTNLWTTGLIVGGMIAASAYVSTTNDQVGQLAEAKKLAETQLEEAKRLLTESNFRTEMLQRQRDDAISQRDFFKESSEMLAGAVPALKLGDAVSRVSLNVPATGTALVSRDLAALDDTDATAAADSSDATLTMNLANIVWMVDGSRRFPMASGDILWIPEGKFSIRYERVGGVRKHKLTRCEGRSACNNLTGISIDPLPLITNEPFKPYRETVPTRGSTNCIEITLHEESRRPGFTDSEFVDIEVLYSKNDTCSP